LTFPSFRSIVGYEFGGVDVEEIKIAKSGVQRYVVGAFPIQFIPASQQEPPQMIQFCIRTSYLFHIAS
jgi:hypothetical protein